MIVQRTTLALSLFAAVLVAANAQAGVILAPTGAVINSGGPGFGLISHTFDQSGLSAGYVSGVTDFDTYIASNPEHTNTFAGFEWFSNQFPNLPVIVTFDLGAAYDIDAMAFWNDGDSGTSNIDLATSTDGVTFTAAASGLSPTNNAAFPTPYLADVFGFGPVNAQFIRLTMLGPQVPNAGFDAVAFGELAFRQAPPAVVPEPASLAVWSALGGVGLLAARRRRRSAKR